MRKWLTGAAIVIPILEIIGIVLVARAIGGWATFALIVLTGILGVYLAKREGKRVFRDVQQQLSLGQMPTGSILDGICIFAGGVLLIVPGFLSDIVGLLLILPLTRPSFKVLLLLLLQKLMAKGNRIIFFRR